MLIFISLCFCRDEYCSNILFGVEISVLIFLVWILKSSKCFGSYIVNCFVLGL